MKWTALLAVASSCFSSVVLADNQPPNAVFRTRPLADHAGWIEGTSPFPIEFNMCPSSDLDEGDQLKFTYDFDADGSVDYFGHCRAQTTYTNTRSVATSTRARICVWDRQPFDGHEICEEFGIRVNSVGRGAGASGVGGLLYVSSSGDGLTSFVVDPSTGELSRVASTAHPVGQLRLEPTRRFAIVSGFSSMASLELDGRGGATLRSQGSNTSSHLSIHPSGRFAYSTNVARNVVGFVLDAAGILTPVPGSPYPAGQDIWGLATHPSGRWCYVGGRNSIVGYGIDGATGSLATLGTFGFQASHLAMDPLGRFLYTIDGAFLVRIYTIDPTSGSLTFRGTTAAGVSRPVAISVHPNGRYAYVGGMDDAIFAFAVDASTGALSPLPGSPMRVPGTLQPNDFTYDPSGNFLYCAFVSSPLALSPGKVAGFSVDPSTGELMSVPGSPWTVGGFAWSIAGP